MKKTKNRSDFDFNANYSRIAEPTLRKNREKEEKDVRFEGTNNIFQFNRFDLDDVEQIFLNKSNIIKFSCDSNTVDLDPTSKTENQCMMKMYAELANLHLKNIIDY